MEETAIMRFSKVNFSLASLDVFKPDFVLQVNATDSLWRYFLFTKSPDETVALSQPMIDERILATWMERPSTQCVAMCILIDSVDQFHRNNCMHEWPNLTSSITSCDWFLDQLRNRLIVQDGLREIRIDGGAEAKQD
jgi:hypothetical protein